MVFDLKSLTLVKIHFLCADFSGAHDFSLIAVIYFHKKLVVHLTFYFVAKKFDAHRHRTTRRRATWPFTFVEKYSHL